LIYQLASWSKNQYERLGAGFGIHGHSDTWTLS
jgi:hypothetical protein